MSIKKDCLLILKIQQTFKYSQHLNRKSLKFFNNLGFLIHTYRSRNLPETNASISFIFEMLLIKIRSELALYEAKKITQYEFQPGYLRHPFLNIFKI